MGHGECDWPVQRSAGHFALVAQWRRGSIGLRPLISHHATAFQAAPARDQKWWLFTALIGNGP